MGKLYFLDESEKNRILDIHKTVSNHDKLLKESSNANAATRVQNKLKEIDPNFSVTGKMDQATINKVMEILTQGISTNNTGNAENTSNVNKDVASTFTDTTNEV